MIVPATRSMHMRRRADIHVIGMAMMVVAMAMRRVVTFVRVIVMTMVA